MRLWPSPGLADKQQGLDGCLRWHQTNMFRQSSIASILVACTSRLESAIVLDEGLCHDGSLTQPNALELLQTLAVIHEAFLLDSHCRHTEMCCDRAPQLCSQATDEASPRRLAATAAVRVWQIVLNNCHGGFTGWTKRTMRALLASAFAGLGDSESSSSFATFAIPFDGEQDTHDAKTATLGLRVNDSWSDCSASQLDAVAQVSAGLDGGAKACEFKGLLRRNCSLLVQACLAHGSMKRHQVSAMHGLTPGNEFGAQAAEVMACAQPTLTLRHQWMRTGVSAVKDVHAATQLLHNATELLIARAATHWAAAIAGHEMSTPVGHSALSAVSAQLVYEWSGHGTPSDRAWAWPMPLATGCIATPDGRSGIVEEQTSGHTTLVRALLASGWRARSHVHFARNMVGPCVAELAAAEAAFPLSAGLARDHAGGCAQRGSFAALSRALFAGSVLLNAMSPLSLSNAAVSIGVTTESDTVLRLLAASAAVLAATSPADAVVLRQAPLLVTDVLDDALGTGVPLFGSKGRRSCGMRPADCRPARTTLDSLAFALANATYVPTQHRCSTTEGEAAMSHLEGECTTEANAVVSHGASLSPLDLQSQTRSVPGLFVNLALLFDFRLGGMLDAARAHWFFSQAAARSQDPGYLLRRSMQLPAVFEDPDAASTSRNRLLRATSSLQHLIGPSATVRVGTVPFYVTYHGMDDDRPLLEAFSRIVRHPWPQHLAGFQSRLHAMPQYRTQQDAEETARAAVPGKCFRLPDDANRIHGLRPVTSWLGVAAAMQAGIDPCVAAGERRARVVFLSRYFTMNHAHGQLIHGVVAGIDRRYFEVVLAHLPSTSQFLDESLLAAADRAVPIRETHAIQDTAELEADVIIFTDQLSDMKTFTLTDLRLASVQAVFWGNPTTPGKPECCSDFFLSGDRMEANGEPPVGGTQELLPAGIELYSEQLLRAGGQGIWYNTPTLPQQVAGGGGRSAFGLPEGVVLVGCPQSSFKMHPSLDVIFAAVLRAVPNSRLVVVSARYQAWQALLEDRWRQKLPDLLHRIIVVPRQPNGSAFYRLLACLDLLIHPTPFGGSKTAADALSLGIPLVSLPTRHLRARMARSLLLSAGLPGLLASSPVDMVRRVVQLALDPTLREAVGAAMRAGSEAIWERQEVILEWQLWLMTALCMPRARRLEVREKHMRQRLLDDQRLSGLLQLHQSLSRRLTQPQVPPTPDECATWGESACVELSAGFLDHASQQAQARPLPWELP